MYARNAFGAMAMAAAVAAVSPSTLLAGALTPGDLVVTRLDNGGASLVNSGNSVILDEFTTATNQAAPVTSIALPNSGPNSYVLSTTKTEGELNLSADKSQLTFFGYNATPGEYTDVRSQPNRTDEVGTANSAGTLSFPAKTVNAFNPLDSGAHQVRGSYTTDNTNYYIGGDDGGNTAPQAGLYYLSSGNPTASKVTTSAPQGRFVTMGPDGNIYGYVKGAAAPYASAIVNLGASGSNAGATPPVIVQPSTPNYNFNAVDAFQFVTFHNTPGFQNGDLLYLSDDGAGLLKYQYENGAWGTDGYNTVGGSFSTGMTAVSDGTNVTLYTVNATGTKLLAFSDTNAMTDSAAAFTALSGTTIATAPTNDAFRGVSFAPVPEPASLGLLAISALASLRRRRA